MIAAAEQGDLVAARAAFDDGRDSLRSVVDDLKARQLGLNVDLAQAIEDAQQAFDQGAEAGRIVEIGKKMLNFLFRSQ